MGEKARANAAVLACGANVGVPNQDGVLDRLQSHDALQRSLQRAAIFVTPERDPFVNLLLEVRAGL